MKHPDDDRLPILSTLLIITSFTLIHIPKSLSQDNQYQVCGEAFRCGNINFTYPFWGGSRPNTCGYPGFEVSCLGNVPRITVSPVAYRVLGSPDTVVHTLRVARDDLFSTTCPTQIQDTAMNFSIFNYSNTQNLSLYYGCPQVPAVPFNMFTCNVNGRNPTSYYFINNMAGNTPPGCTDIITVPIDQNQVQNLLNPTSLSSVLETGFTLRYDAENSNCQSCTASNGRCGYASNSFICYCADRANNLECNGTPTQNGNGMLNIFNFTALISQDEN